MDIAPVNRVEGRGFGCIELLHYLKRTGLDALDALARGRGLIQSSVILDHQDRLAKNLVIDQRLFQLDHAACALNGGNDIRGSRAYPLPANGCARHHAHDARVDTA